MPTSRSGGIPSTGELITRSSIARSSAAMLAERQGVIGELALLQQQQCGVLLALVVLQMFHASGVASSGGVTNVPRKW
jgi:hypothetical protein